MPNLNKVMLMGNLTRDVEVKYLQNQQAVAKLGLAINRRWKSAEGEAREETTFVDCEAWGKTAEILGKYLSKGRPVFIEGRLKLDQWEKDGQKFSKLKVVIDAFEFVDSKPGGGPGGGSGGGDFDEAPQVQTRPANRPTTRSAPSAPAAPPMGDDDIPF